MVATATRPDVVRLYDRLAPRYDRLHARWLRHAGGEAQAALEGAVRALLRPGMTLLDAGCGTGRLARALIAEGVPSAGTTLLDPSEAMLRRCADLPVRRVVGRLERLPFADGAFDIVTCAWAIETAARPEAALAELCRVVRPGGTLCLVFCADARGGGLAARLMRWSVERRGAGRFLHPGMVHDALVAASGVAPRWLPCRGPAAACLVRRRKERLPKRETAGGAGARGGADRRSGRDP
jgi:ubiquinone/menaquinone biosynthesis C-methylase UbiE